MTPSADRFPMAGRASGPWSGRCAVAVALALCQLPIPVPAAEPAAGPATGNPCTSFTFPADVERQLFIRGQPAREVRAGIQPGRSPQLKPDVLYDLTLGPATEVLLAGEPSSPATPGSHAGLATFRSGAAGRYRVSADAAARLDLVAHGSARPAVSFSGSPGCSTPHKIVVFALAAREQVTLQVTSAALPVVRIAITREP